MCSKTMLMVEGLTPNYTPIKEEWLRLFGRKPGVGSPTLREGIHPGIVSRMPALPDGRASDADATQVYEPLLEQV